MYTELHRKKRKQRYLLLLLWIMLLALVAVALNVGAANTDWRMTLRTLFLQGDTYGNIVVWGIRLPRIMAGIAAGAGLAIAGAVMQTCLRNPIASPSTLGISNAAAFGANLAIVTFGAGTYKNSASGAVWIDNPYTVTIFALIFSVFAMVSILALARLRGFSPEAVVLAGVAFGSLFSAGSTLIQYFADDVQVTAMVFWTFGDLGRITWREWWLLAAVVVIASVYFLFNRWNYNALDSGEVTAESLGTDVPRLRFMSMFLASLITTVTVSFMGIIGFIGLIAPQMMRRLVGNDHRILLPASALAGSVLLLFADTVARTLISPIVLPVGAITSFFGAPLFLFLLMKGAKRR